MSTLHRWPRCGGGWRRPGGCYAEYADARAAAVTRQLLDRGEVGSGDRVLELACGAGGTGLAAAHRVGPHGQVVLSDLAPEMTDIARDRAAELGLGNVTARSLDLQQIDEPDRRLRCRALPRRSDVRARPGCRGHRDPSRPADGWPAGRGRLGSAGAQPLARCGLRRGDRRNRPAGAAARHPRAVRAGRSGSPGAAARRVPGSATSGVRAVLSDAATSRSRRGGRAPAPWPDRSPNGSRR